LTYKEKILKKGLHCAFFLSIVQISGEKWVFVGNCPLSYPKLKSFKSVLDV